VITGGVVWAAGDIALGLTAPYATAVICAALVYPAVAAFEGRSRLRAR